MINLLSYDNKLQVRAARANVTLAKCLILTVSAMIFLSLYCFVTYNFIKASKTTIPNGPSSNQTLDANSVAVLAQTNSLKTNLATAKTIIDKQISYSDILLSFASALPAGVIIDSLAINNNSTFNPISLTLKASSAEKSQQIKDSLDKSTFFSNYSVKSVLEDKNNTSGYRFTIAATVLLKKATKQ